MAILSSCSCFQGGDEETATPSNSSTTIYRGVDDQGCNYLTDENCTRPKAKNYNQAQDYRRPADLYVYDSPRPHKVEMYRDQAPQQVYVSVQETLPTPVPVIVATPSPVTIPTPMPVTKTVASCGDIKTTTAESTLPDGSPCPTQIKETREPVEVIYKKTTYKTVYEPKTTSSVSYEKEPYKQGSVEIQATPDVVEQISITAEDAMPADEIK